LIVKRATSVEPPHWVYTSNRRGSGYRDSQRPHPPPTPSAVNLRHGPLARAARAPPASPAPICLGAAVTRAVTGSVLPPERAPRQDHGGHLFCFFFLFARPPRVRCRQRDAAWQRAPPPCVRAASADAARVAPPPPPPPPCVAPSRLCLPPPVAASRSANIFGAGGAGRSRRPLPPPLPAGGGRRRARAPPSPLTPPPAAAAVCRPTAPSEAPAAACHTPCGVRGRGRRVPLVGPSPRPGP